MIVKNEIRLAATPVTARIIPIMAPHIVDATRGTLGIMVFRLLPAIKAQKHVGGIDATANNRNIAEAMAPPEALMMSSKFHPSSGLPACAPATEISGSPAATRAASAMP